MRLSFILMLPVILFCSVSSFCNEKGVQSSGPPCLNVTPQHISGQWSSLKENKRVKAWLISLVEDPSSLQSNQDGYIFPALHLFELKGFNNRFDRKTSPVRSLFEKAIVEDVEKVLEGKPRDALVKLLVLQPIGYLQESFILGHLLKQGRTHIEFTFVDFGSAPTSFQGFEELQKALADEGVFLTVRKFSSLKDVPQKSNNSFHVGYSCMPVEKALSFEALDDVLSAKNLIGPEGHFFLSQLDGTIAISNSSAIRIIEMTKKAETACKAILEAQFKSSKPKDRPLRVVAYTNNPSFILGPLFYVSSEFLRYDYRDIVLSVAFPPGLDSVKRKIFSKLYECLNPTSCNSQFSFDIKTKIYVGDKTEFGKDMFIFWYEDVELQNHIGFLRGEIILTRLSLNEQGCWIVCGKDLGLWQVNKRGTVVPISVSEDKTLLASAMMKDLFTEGNPIYK